jgi:hypothetical protein
MHVHVQCAHGEAEFWLELSLVLARSTGLSAAEIRVIEDLIKEHRDEITSVGRKHFER